jgi:AraC family transcriptional regulator of adaptative response/methylated-DNA-[protein]-cysteine methyltransferase
MIDGSIAYTLLECSLGHVLVAGTPRGLCHVAFGEGEDELRAGLAARFPFAAPERDDARLESWAERLVDYAEGHARRLDVPLDVGGTRFQREVWSALRRIPRGTTRCYGEIARELGRRRGARAVARACAANPVPVAIPCHRVVPAGGGVGGYAFGSARKRLLLEREGALPREGERAATGEREGAAAPCHR